MIEIGDILANQTMQMSLLQDEHVIQTFSPDTAHEAFTDCVGFRSTHWRSDDLDSPPVRDLCETLPVLAVIISNEKTGSFIVRRCVSYLLGNPEITGCAGHAIVDNPTRA